MLDLGSIVLDAGFGAKPQRSEWDLGPVAVAGAG